MTQIDTAFLTSLGLSDLPQDKQQEIAQQLQTELEERVGEKLTAGMSDEQLAEFDALMENDEQAVQQWLQANRPNYSDREDFKVLTKEAGIAEDQPVPSNVLSGYAVASWIEVHHPDYKEVVDETMKELKAELLHNRDVILGKA